jgi:DNA-binding SARP family transcriptional activator
MAVKVLGPLDTGSTAPLSPRERAVLAALIVRAPAPMSGAELADAHWGERLPETWAQQVKTSINRVRSRIGAEAIQTTAGGYRFALEPESVDAVRFEQLVAAARGQALRGEPARAIDTYRRALALWRGTPYPDLVDWEPGRAEAARLSGIRASAEEELLEARLGNGEGRTVIPDAERLVREQPLREEPWALLALANYRADRQAEALAVLRTARKHLDEELGIAPGARLSKLETAILRQDPSLVPAPPANPSADCPYRGLQAFGPQDADAYVGREDDIERVLGRLRPGALVAIAGPSGCGKSSLMLAGVVPRLRAAGRVVELVGPGGGGAERLRRAAELAGPSGVIAVDQTEELFAGLPDAEVAALCNAARSHLAAGGVVVATVRSDFIDRAVALPAIGADLARDLLILGPLRPDAVRAAVEEPARRAGLLVEPGLTELIMRDVGSRPAVLPHLSHALVGTWQRREGTTLTVAGYASAGGIAGAIAQSAEQCYTGLAEHEQEVARSLLLRLVDRGADRVTVRRAGLLGPLVADPERRKVLDGLVAARLITIAENTVLVAHEAVATAWPRLDDWLTTDAAESLLLRQVGSAADNWEASGRSEDDLLRGARLQAALEWRAHANTALTEPEQEFLDASEDRALAAHRELVERAGHDRRQNRRLRWALGAAAFLLVAASAGGGAAVLRRAEVAQASAQARIDALTSTSLALRSSAPELAALLAVASYRNWPDDPRARSALWGVVTAAGSFTGTTAVPDADSASAALIPGTRQAVVVRDRSVNSKDPQKPWEADVALVDIDTGEVLRAFPDPGLARSTEFPLRAIEVSADGRVALIQTGFRRENGHCCRNRLDFVDLTSGKLLPGSRMLDSRTSNRHALSEDGATAYILNSVTAELITVDTTTGAVAPSSRVPPESTQDLFNPFGGIAIIDRNRIATSGDGEIVVWDRRSLTALRRVAVPEGYATEALGVDPAGSIVGTGSLGMVRVDLRSGKVLWKHRVNPTTFYSGLEVDTAGQAVYAADTKGVIEEFSLATGESTGRRFTALRGGVGQPVVTRSGQELVLVGSAIGDYVSGAKTGFVHWGLDSGPASTVVAPGRLVVGGFDKGGGRILVAPRGYTGDTGTEVWDVARRAALSLPRGNYQGWVAGDVLLDRVQWKSARLFDLDTQTPTQLAADAAFGDSPFVDPKVVGGVGRNAFVIERDRIVPIDTTTGAPAGPVLHFPADILARADQDGYLGTVSSVSESPAGDRLVVTWWVDAGIVSETSVFDLATGKELVRGLAGAKITRVTSGGEILGVAADQITVSSLEYLDVRRLVSRPGGSTRDLTISADGRTALITTWDQQAWLYDIASGTSLGDPLASDVPGWAPAYLNPDGQTLVINSSRGVLMWDLDPAPQAEAACRLAGREPTAAEWTIYLSDLGPQRPICR